MADHGSASARRFWSTHALWPALGFGLAFTLIEVMQLDRKISHALFYDQNSNHWLGSGDGQWWARALIHTAGGWFVRAVAAVAIALWIASFCTRRLRTWRRGAGFAVAALALSIGIVGGLKSVTNVDCPWDLAEFGGDRPYVGLFSDRPDFLPRAKCFPGAHASSGFGLLFGYFLLRDRSRGRAALALVAAIAIGVTFSIGQEARGAHFVSHDLTAAAIVWFVQLILYALVLAPQRRGEPPVTTSHSPHA